LDLWHAIVKNGSRKQAIGVRINKRESEQWPGSDWAIFFLTPAISGVGWASRRYSGIKK
jgi:hypothetical protein